MYSVFSRILFRSRSRIMYPMFSRVYNKYNRTITMQPMSSRNIFKFR